jgi:hypothetical protein
MEAVGDGGGAADVGGGRRGRWKTSLADIDLFFYFAGSKHLMKRLLLSVLIFPVAGIAGLHRANSGDNAANPNDNLVEIRSGEWPMNLERGVERRDTSYSLIFRDQQVEAAVVMDTLNFSNLTQLKYFGQALTVLKNGHNGDIATSKEYSLKRADKKFEGIWYILRIKFGITDFRQTEADLMSKTIKGL